MGIKEYLTKEELKEVKGMIDRLREIFRAESVALHMEPLSGYPPYDYVINITRSDRLL